MKIKIIVTLLVRCRDWRLNSEQSVVSVYLHTTDSSMVSPLTVLLFFISLSYFLRAKVCYFLYVSGLYLWYNFPIELEMLTVH